MIGDEKNLHSIKNPHRINPQTYRGIAVICLLMGLVILVDFLGRRVTPAMPKKEAQKSTEAAAHMNSLRQKIAHRDSVIRAMQMQKVK